MRGTVARRRYSGAVRQATRRHRLRRPGREGCVMDAYADPEAAMRADGIEFSDYRPPNLADFLSTGSWLERKLEPPEPLLGEIITNTTRMFIGGSTGLGKTHLGMAM